MNETVYHALCACFGLPSATSIVATPHRGDHSFRLTSPSTNDPPLAVVEDSPISPQASVLIREAYREPENAPRPPRNTDVIYYSLAPDPAAREAPAVYSEEDAGQGFHTAAVSRFSAWNLQVVCYGAHALANARKIRAFLYADGPGFPRSILRKAGLYPVPDPPEPTLLHEPEGGLWRQRADLTVSLCREEKETHPVRRGAIENVPAVILHQGS